MNKLLESFGWAMNGFRTVWKEEKNFRIEAMIAGILVVMGAVFSFSLIEWIILLGATGAVLAAEILNTAVEDLCNKIEPKFDPTIGKVKDIMAGFVLFVAGCAVLIGVLLVTYHFYK